MQGAIRLTDDKQNNFYVAWHVPAVGQNACAVEIKGVGNFISAEDFKKNSVINPGTKLMTHTVLKGRYSISCGVSDPDTEFPKIVVFIDGPVR